MISFYQQYALLLSFSVVPSEYYGSVASCLSVIRLYTSRRPCTTTNTLFSPVLLKKPQQAAILCYKPLIPTTTCNCVFWEAVDVT